MIHSRNSNRLIMMLGTIALLLFIVACGGTHRSNDQIDDEDYVWPLPPDTPKIRYIKSIHSEMDVGRKKSFAQKVSEGLFGRSPLLALKKPLTVHEDQQGRLHVVDTGWRKVLVFDFMNQDMEIIGAKGQGRLFNPLGVTTDNQNRIYVSDADGYRIMIYKPNGKFLKAIGGKGILFRPAGLAVNSELGRVYVVDSWAHQVKVFDNESGEELFTLGKEEAKEHRLDELPDGVLDLIWNRGSETGEFRFPTYVTIDPEGNIYIVDTLNFRVQIFNQDGEFISSFGEIGNLPGNLFRPKGIGLDSEGHIYVADASFNNIQIFSRDGKLLLNFGTFGSGLADLRLPAGLSINDKDQIFVVDQFNHRVQIYQFMGNEPNKSKENITEKGRR